MDNAQHQCQLFLILETKFHIVAELIIFILKSLHFQEKKLTFKNSQNIQELKWETRS